jgi:hypothetical protein
MLGGRSMAPTSQNPRGAHCIMEELSEPGRKSDQSDSGFGHHGFPRSSACSRL